jgi:hypothetical protein
LVNGQTIPLRDQRRQPIPFRWSERTVHQPLIHEEANLVCDLRSGYVGRIVVGVERLFNRV